MRVLVTGSDGFIGKNLITRLNELNIEVVVFTRDNSIDDLIEHVEGSDFIVHLAGENRPIDDKSFHIVNAGLASSICEAIRLSRKATSIIYASSTQVGLDNSYGKSKLEAEIIIKKVEDDTKSKSYIYRLPSVFGKWCKPNYNSVVATFCHNVSHNFPIQVSDPSIELTLIYIDDVINEFVSIIQGKEACDQKPSVQPEYKIKLGELATQIKKFKESRGSLISERVSDGLISKLYSTYVSYLHPNKFSYSIPSYKDERGVFAEVLKTKDSGQFSFFTAGVGVTRGGHYHHSKTEKFLVAKGIARFNFRHIITNESYEITVSDKELKIVETVPGWAHEVTNVGREEMVVMLWSNEIFDPSNPDTFTSKV